MSGILYMIFFSMLPVFCLFSQKHNFKQNPKRKTPEDAVVLKRFKEKKNKIMKKIETRLQNSNQVCATCAQK